MKQVNKNIAFLKNPILERSYCNNLFIIKFTKFIKFIKIKIVLR